MSKWTDVEQNSVMIMNKMVGLDALLYLLNILKFTLMIAKHISGGGEGGN